MPERNHSASEREPPTVSRVSFGEFVFDATTGELIRRDGKTVQLEPQPAKVLRFLADRAGSVVSRSELRRHVWADGRHVEADQGLNYCIRELRRALGDSAQDPRYIETLRRRGYRFLQDVQDVEPMDVERPSADPGPGAPDPAPLPGAGEFGREEPARRRIPWLPVVVLAAAVGLAAIWAMQAQQSATTYGAPAAEPRIGVLAFDAPGGVESDEDLAAAVAAALVSELTRLGDRSIEVIPATSSFAYRGSGKTVDEIAGALRADYLVEGSVRAGEEVRVLDVRLVDTGEESIVWSETYPAGAPVPDALAETVARDVTETLGFGAARPSPPETKVRPDSASELTPAGASPRDRPGLRGAREPGSPPG
ncbi:MAG: winged helix-turn-helix domain-containing protein [bacterium]